jgi:hypothetical protein
MALMARQVNQKADRLGLAGMALLGQIAIPGRGEQVRVARAFVGRVLRVFARAGAGAGPGALAARAALDNAVLLTSELVTNAIRHSDSGAPGGTVTLAVRRMADGIRVEVTDGGSAGGPPVVKDDVYTCDGHGLYLVEALADDWGYQRSGRAGTTVWFVIGASSRAAAW